MKTEGHDSSQHMRVDGIDIQTEGSGRSTVLMLHGWPDTAALWDPQVQALREHVRCARFTLPGFDRRHPRRVRGIDEIVATIAHVVDAVSPGAPVVLMLHDWGCVFGYHFARTHPQRVAAIVGIDVGDAGSREHLASLHWKAKAGMVAYQGLLALAWHLPRPLGDAVTRSTARWARAPGAVADIGAHMNYPYHVQWARGYGRRPFMPHCPMLFVWGEHKPFMFHSRAWLKELASRPGCRVQGMPAGHWVSRQVSAAFNHVVVDWLSNLSRSA